jgi:pyruvate-formate lyase-activating enzyme
MHGAINARHNTKNRGISKLQQRWPNQRDDFILRNTPMTLPLPQQLTSQPRDAGLARGPVPMERDCDLPDGRFQDYRCNADHLRKAFLRAPEFGRTAAELMPMVEVLGRMRAGDFASLADLKTRACGRGAAEPSADAIRVMRDLFLEIPNRRLQDLYRNHFSQHPYAPAARHDDKIVGLATTWPDAQRIVAALDWAWLADWLRLDLIGETQRDSLLRLSNFALPVRRVNFRFTYHCNISCRHCYNSSGPHAKAQRIELDAMRAIIAQMPGAGIAALNLTGGEPFLYPDDLMALIAAGRAARLDTISIYTNGFWAETAEKADKMLARLATAGLMQGAGDFIKVSTGAYHQEFVGFDRIVLLAQRYHRMFARKLPVDYEVAPGGKDHSADIRKDLAIEGLDRCIAISFRETQPLGRARDLPGNKLKPIDVPCGIIEEIVFDPDGTARPCCGFNNENDGVAIGMADVHSLRDLVKRMQNDPVLQFLARNPMNAIFQHIGVERNAKGYAGPCNLCQHALGALADKEQLQARLFDQQEFFPFWFSQPDGIGGRA